VEDFAGDFVAVDLNVGWWWLVWREVVWKGVGIRIDLRMIANAGGWE